MSRFLFSLLIIILPVSAHSQLPAVKASKQWINSEGSNILSDFAEILKIPNHASDSVNISKNAVQLDQMFSKRGFDMQVLELPGAPPVVYGERLVAGATRTLCFYVHYDGQPVDPEQWVNPPFDPVMYDKALFQDGKRIEYPKKNEPIDPNWRIYARSTGDDKAPLIALSAALDALENSNIDLTSNIKLFFDGEEESSSPNLVDYLETYSDLFDDISVWLLCDGSVFQTGAPQLKFGGRGVTSMEITVYGASRPLHSGHYSNWAPVPGQMLARLLTSMKAEDGSILIEGYYDSVEPISDFEKQQISKIPNIDEFLKKDLGLVQTEGNGQSVFEQLLLPTLTVRGLSSGNVGSRARNIIPSTATATLGLRLVKGNDPEAMLDLIEAHIKNEGWQVVYEDPDHETRLKYPKIIKVKRNKNGYPAGKGSMDDPQILPVINAVKAYTGDKLVLLPSSGGSNKMYYVIYNMLKKPAISVNIANFDNNQHAADENITIGSLWYGIELYSVLLTMPQGPEILIDK